MTGLEALTAAVERGDRTAAADLTTAALSEGADPKTVLDAMSAAMETVSVSFTTHQKQTAPITKSWTPIR